MNHNIQFDGLKSVVIDGKEHEIQKVDIHRQGNTIGIAVQLKAQIHAVTLCMVFVNDEGEQS